MYLGVLTYLFVLDKSGPVRLSDYLHLMMNRCYHRQVLSQTGARRACYGTATIHTPFYRRACRTGQDPEPALEE